MIGVVVAGAGEAVTGLDMVLVDGARGPLRRLVPPARTTLNLARALAGKPDVVGKRARYLVRELGRIGMDEFVNKKLIRVVS